METLTEVDFDPNGPLTPKLRWAKCDAATVKRSLQGHLTMTMTASRVLHCKSGTPTGDEKT